MCPNADGCADTVHSDDMTLEAAKTLVVKVMSKSLDSTNLSAEKRKHLSAWTNYSLEAVIVRKATSIPRF